MSDPQKMISRAVVYRWLAQFFLGPPTLATLQSYRGPDGRAWLSECKAVPALAPFVALIEAAVASEADLTQQQALFANAYNQAFHVGGPRSAPPYASVYLSERGLMFQRPTREMDRLLAALHMRLPDRVNEPTDHLGIQLHIAAELCNREAAGQSAPLSICAFLETHVLTWLPAFVARCEKLPDPVPIGTLARAVLGQAKADVEAGDVYREVG